MYTGEWHRTRCIGSNAVSFIFSQEAHTDFPIRVSRLFILIILLLMISNFVIWIIRFFDFSMSNSDSYNALSRRQLLSFVRGARMVPGSRLVSSQFTNPFWLSSHTGRSPGPAKIIFVIDYLVFLLSRRNLALWPGSSAVSISVVLYPMISLYCRTSWLTAGLRSYRNPCPYLRHIPS